MYAAYAYWGIAALVAAAIPVAHLYQRLRVPGTRYLLAMMMVCALYPWLIALQPLTQFDSGLAYGLLGLIGPLYLLTAIGYVQRTETTWHRYLLLLPALLLCAAALGNPWLGGFAGYPELGGASYANATPGFGLKLMSALNFCLMLPAVRLMYKSQARKGASGYHAVTASVLPITVGLAHALVYVDLPAITPPLRGHAFPATTTFGMALFALLLVRLRGDMPVRRSQLLNLIPDAMVVVTAAGSVVDYNDNFAKLWRRRTRAMLGEPLSDFIPNSVWQTGAQGGPRSVSLTLPDGKRIFDVRVKALHDASSSPTA